MSNVREFTDAMDPARAQALHVTLGLDGPAPGQGDPLPPFWHYAWFWDAEPVGALGRDGHPRVGGFIPDLGFPRRMWAGGELWFDAPLKLGATATKISRIERAERKDGRSGAFGLVTVTHEIRQNDGVCLREHQSLFYRPEADESGHAEPPMARTDEAICKDRRFSTTDLFRYSALTFNGHRIHYDRDYATGIEGYPGLIVHGPLLAQLLIHLAEGLLGSVKRFKFRATAPLFDHETAQFCASPENDRLALWVRGPDGRQCMIARAEVGSS